MLEQRPEGREMERLEEHLLPLEEEHPGQWRTRGRGPAAAL